MIYILLGILVLVIDFVSKRIVMSNMALGEKIGLIDGVFSLTYIRNKGMAWGLLQNQRWIFIVLTVLIIGAIIFYIVRTKKIHKTGLIGFSFIISGAVGNMIDRLFYEDGVVDFFHAEFIDFPIFNVADMAVCIGAGFIILYALFFDKKEY